MHWRDSSRAVVYYISNITGHRIANILAVIHYSLETCLTKHIFGLWEETQKAHAMHTNLR